MSRPLRIALGLLVLAVLVALGPDPRLLGTALEQAWTRACDTPAIGLAALLGMAVSYALRAARLQLELSRDGPAPYALCLRLQALHTAAISVLPLRGGELSYPWLLRRWLGRPAPTAWASLVWLRLQDALMLGVAALLLLAPGPWTLRLAAAALGLSLVAWALHRLPRRTVAAAATADPTAAAVAAALPATALAVGGGSGWPRFVTALRAGPAHGALGWVCTVGHWSAKLVGLGIALALLAPADPLAAARGVVGGEVAALWPLQAPAGLGTYEAGVWAGLHGTADGRAESTSGGAAAVGAERSARWIAAALALHAFMVAFALASAGGAWLTARGRRPHDRIADPAMPAGERAPSRSVP